MQISAYLDNVFDVAALMEDSETKSAAIERVSELEDEVSVIKEMYQKLEMDSLSRMVEMESRIKEICSERDSLISKQKEIDEEVTTLRRTVTQKEEESRNLMEKFRSSGSHLTVEADSTSKSPVPTAGPPPPAPPPPPPPPSMGGGGSGPPPPPIFPGLSGPPPPPMMGGGKANMTIKRALQPKCKLPTLNWTVLKPRDVKGTVFNQLDDSKYYNSIDFDQFERIFRIGPAPGTASRIFTVFKIFGLFF